MHICSDEINLFLSTIPYVGVGLALARSAIRHGWRALAGKFRRPR